MLPDVHPARHETKPIWVSSYSIYARVQEAVIVGLPFNGYELSVKSASYSHREILCGPVSLGDALLRLRAILDEADAAGETVNSATTLPMFTLDGHHVQEGSPVEIGTAAYGEWLRCKEASEAAAQQAERDADVDALGSVEQSRREMTYDEIIAREA